MSNEGKGKDKEKKPRGGRRKNAFGGQVKMVSNEIRDWAKKASGEVKNER